MAGGMGFVSGFQSLCLQSGVVIMKSFKARIVIYLLCVLTLLSLFWLHVSGIKRQSMREQQWNVLINTALSNVRDGNYKRAVRQLSAALENARSRHDDPEVGCSLYSLASTYRVLGDDVKAERCCRQALASLERLSGKERSQLPRALRLMSTICNDKGHYQVAESFASKAVAESTTMFGNKNPETAQSMDALAHVYRIQKRYSKSEALFKRALAIRHKAGHKSDLEEADSLNGLGLLYIDMGRYKEAETLLRQELAIRKRILGPEKTRVAKCMGELASLKYKQGDLREARRLSEGALEITGPAFGDNQRDSLHHLDLCVCCDLRLGDYAHAEPLIKRLLRAHEQRYGVNSPQLIKVLCYYGQLLEKTGRLRESQIVSDRIRKIDSDNGIQKI
jgi:tetratricopeptide (TPR) repeat protein